ncbi:MAG: hypothetical protein GY764_11045 [Halieaceae bacterium]|nr:hypothetical protein [Halieaceae bacterium]
MTEAPISPGICPHLGLANDPSLRRSNVSANHRCYAREPEADVNDTHQSRFCLTSGHTVCPFYKQPAPAALASDDEVEDEGWSSWRLVYVAVLIVAGLIIALVYGREIVRFMPTVPETTTTPPALLVALDADTPTPPVTPEPVQQAATPTHFATPTPVSGGRIVSLSPKAGEAGWWGSAETRGNHLGDSYLYAGYYQDQAFISAFQLDLSRVPRGAPIQSALLRLHGLSDDRFTAESGGAWSLSLLASDALPELRRADFQTLLNAPAAATLIPAVDAAELAVGQVNTWELDPSALAWLQQQVLDGITELVVRIIGPGGGEPTLFAWDTGSGPSSRAEAPELMISLGAPPNTPPPLPTREVIVATLTPTPENVMTVAANLLTATAVATRRGTYTPIPANIVTPTPTPENLATAQALALIQGQAPVVIHTPTPVNEATATANALYATAVALTTGTFTPMPTNAVIAQVITPTPQPENLATAAIIWQTATVQAQLLGTPTPLPFDIIVATTTPDIVMITATPRPKNAATATEVAAFATVVSLTTGTFTPVPASAVTPTPTPRATQVPLLVYQMPTPQHDATATPVRNQVPNALRGKILFYSDRPAPDVGVQTYLWALDPANGRLAYVTQPWVYEVAQANELRAQAPGGVFRLSVEPDAHRTLQVYTFDTQYGIKTQLSYFNGMTYDPSWAPSGDRIAFVSSDAGNDEIYVVGRDGNGLVRLTYNEWEWDKHPSWTPNGDRILFHSNREAGRRQLWIMNADGSGQQRFLTSSYNDHSPIWVK